MDRLLKHNIALRENFSSVWAVKESLKDDNLEDAIMYWYELPEHIQRDLWVSPRAGGIFTTDERRTMKSDEWGLLRRKASAMQTL